jgi:hypothetical protein
MAYNLTIQQLAISTIRSLGFTRKQVWTLRGWRLEIGDWESLVSSL